MAKTGNLDMYLAKDFIMYMKLICSKILCLVILIRSFNKIAFGQIAHDVVNDNLI